MNDLDTLALQIITLSGSAKSYAMEAIREYKKDAFNKSKEMLEEAKKYISQANQVQEQIIQSQNHEELNLLMVHAQDHLMSTILLIDIVSEILA